MIEQRMADRLRELRTELQAGERMLVEIAEREDALRRSMLRISGAIAVLEELSAPHAEPERAERAERAEPALVGA